MSNPFINTAANDFDIQANRPDNVTQQEYSAQIKYDEIVCEKVRHLSDVINFPLVPGTQYRIITTHAFNAIVVLDGILQKYKIEEIYIAIYRMNRDAVRRLAGMIIALGIPVKILLSSFFRENKRYEKWCEELVSFCDTCDNATVAFYCTHAKVMLAKTVCGKHIVFEGSGNLSDNARIEQYLLEDCETAYNFHASWINNLMGLGE